MKIAALFAALLTPVLAGVAASETPDAALPRLVCLSIGEARNLFATNDLVPPFRVMRDASQLAQAEAIDIQLCRTGGILVYDVTLLDRDGRVMHKLLGASNGAVLDGRNDDALVQRQPGDRSGSGAVKRRLDLPRPEQREN